MAPSRAVGGPAPLTRHPTPMLLAPPLPRSWRGTTHQVANGRWTGMSGKTASEWGLVTGTSGVMVEPT